MAGLVAGAGVVLLWLLLARLDHGGIPDFSAIEGVAERKAVFVAYLLPRIERVNREVLRQRQRLDALEASLEQGPLGRREERWLRALLERHGIALARGTPVRLGDFERLRLRLDTVPPSLALAQAALESGWGTSRAARKGNNFYGALCFTPGCGLPPEHRQTGAAYEIARYATPLASVRTYLGNLNANPVYAPLWRERARLRRLGLPVRGLELVHGLQAYAADGPAYVEALAALIVAEDLEDYDPVD